VNRTRKAYTTLFRDRLLRLGARKPDDGVARLIAAAEALAQRLGLSVVRALFQVHLRLARAACLRAAAVPGAAGESRFICDVGLGGLARWLRAAGYDSAWQPHIDDASLIRWARQEKAILLTTDSLMFERRTLRDGVQPALWLPSCLNIDEQLALVFAEFALRRKPSRCMACGGALSLVPKEAIWERIPPKTRLWRDTFFRCARCDQIFWHGTHWRRIQDRIRHFEDDPDLRHAGSETGDLLGPAR